MAKIQSDIGRYGITPEWLLDSDISDRAIRLFAVLAAKYINRDTDKAFPARSLLASDLRCSTDSIDRAIKELETIGAVEVERRTLGKERITSLYKVCYVQVPSRQDAATSPQESGIEPESVNQNQQPEIPSSSANATEEGSISPFKLVQNTLESIRGYQSGAFGQEGKAIKQMLDQGYEPGDILNCYQHLKEQHFWSDKSLTMSSVAKEIGEWRKNRDNPPETRAEREQRSHLADFELKQEMERDGVTYRRGKATEDEAEGAGDEDNRNPGGVSVRGSRQGGPEEAARRPMVGDGTGGGDGSNDPASG